MATKIRLDRDTTRLVVDHYTVHVATGTISLHVLEKDVDGNVVRGQDIGEIALDKLNINIPADKIINFLTTKVNLPNNVTPAMEDVIPAVATPAATKAVAAGEELVSG